MDAGRRYDRDEERALRDRLARGEPARCPRCETKLERRSVPPREGVAYVRRRDWYVCGRCGGTLVVDKPKQGPSSITPDV